jgi:hypothetical protein
MVGIIMMVSTIMGIDALVMGTITTVDIDTTMVDAIMHVMATMDTIPVGDITNVHIIIKTEVV